MPRVLILYATTHGHTARVAAHLAAVLGTAGVATQRHRLGAHPGDISPSGFDGVVVAGSVHHGRHQHDVVEWVRAHHLELTLRPTAFVSVSLSAAGDGDEARADARRMIDEFIEDTDWTPDAVAAVPGAVRVRGIDLPTRALRLVARRHGGTRPRAEEHDFTDWDAVDRLARELALRMLRRDPLDQARPPVWSARDAGR
jgi:menaquinone-dependent protoporphyrinogen oxidase